MSDNPAAAGGISSIRRRLAAGHRELRRLARIRKKVRTFFETSYRLRFERYVGDGSHGGTGVFSVRDTVAGGADKYIVKFSLGMLPNREDSDAHLRNEAKWLAWLAGSEHFIKTRSINHLRVKKFRAARDHYDDDNDDDDGDRDHGSGPNTGQRARNVAKDANSSRDSTGLTEDLTSLNINVPTTSDDESQEHDIIPTIVLEYLPLGDLENLRNRFVMYGRPVPSRLLWGIALCRT
jgi:hypothetical protein